jgi:transcriptional regulator with XRE-family HTH domain
MTDKTGGPALKQAIHVARARASITSDMQLALRAGVSYDTLMNWYSGRTTPRPAELKKVADAMDVRLVELMDAWDGRDPEPPELADAIRDLVGEIRADRERNAAMVLALVGIISDALDAISSQLAGKVPVALNGNGHALDRKA